MSASKKLYEAMAGFLNIDIRTYREYPEKQELIAWIIRTSIMPSLSDDNPYFDMHLFYKACGLNIDGYPIRAADVEEGYDA